MSVALRTATSGSRSSLLLGLLAAAVLLLSFLGPFFLIRGGARLIEDLIRWRWPTAHGVVSAVSIEPRRGWRGERFVPIVELAYRVDGQEQSARWSGRRPRSFGQRADAEAWLTRFPVGEPVEVCYSPSQPELGSLLSTSRTRSLLTSGVLLALGVVICTSLGLGLVYLRPLEAA